MLKVSCGDILLSKGTTSYFTPAGLFLLSRSPRYWKMWRTFAPAAAAKPDIGSITAMRTVSPDWANAVPAWSARPAMAARPRFFLKEVMAVSRYFFGAGFTWHTA